MARQMSPCLGCTRVADPGCCEDKQCPLWRRWFIKRWDAMRLQYAQAPEDPCKKCMYPRQLCTLPCRAKREWSKEVSS